MAVSTRWLVGLGCLGAALVGVLFLAFEHTEPPAVPVMVAIVVAVVGLAVGPWLMLVGRQLRKSREADRLFRRVVLIVLLVPVVSTALALLAGGESWDVALVALMSVALAGLIGLIGGVLVPWIFLLTRTVTTERAARVRAEERGEVATHLHDTVLQALTLIQKRTEEPAVLRLARSAERDLRAWLYGAPPVDPDDYASSVRAVVAEIEDRYAVAVELIAVGTCPLDEPARAVVGAVREALTNAARHAGVRRISLFTEATDAEVTALVRDRGTGFDPARPPDPARRGIRDSIEARVAKQGGTATVRSAPGDGTEVEVRMPLRVPA
jgi:signal transduction histidine kinase